MNKNTTDPYCTPSPETCTTEQGWVSKVTAGLTLAFQPVMTVVHQDRSSTDATNLPCSGAGKAQENKPTHIKAPPTDQSILLENGIILHRRSCGAVRGSWESPWRQRPFRDQQAPMASLYNVLYQRPSLLQRAGSSAGVYSCVGGTPPVFFISVLSLGCKQCQSLFIVLLYTNINLQESLTEVLKVCTCTHHMCMVSLFTSFNYLS